MWRAIITSTTTQQLTRIRWIQLKVTKAMTALHSMKMTERFLMSSMNHKNTHQKAKDRRQQSDRPSGLFGYKQQKELIMCALLSGKEKQQWIDNAINGDETCPECKGELKDLWSATYNVSWLECDCGFNYTYERG